MRILVIGDIHGRTTWKDIVKSEKYNEVVFLGDYFDPYRDIPAADLIRNWEEIIDFKVDNSRYVKLLIGNHDTSYFVEDAVQCRFVPEVNEIIGKDTFRTFVSQGLFQLCYNSKNTNLWFSHAGITNTWLKNSGLGLNELEINKRFIESIEGDALDFHRTFDFIQHLENRPDPYGDNKYQGPCWVRPNSLKNDSPEGICQIIGHTRGSQSKLYDKIIEPISQCDRLEHKQYFIIYSDGEDIKIQCKKLDSASK